MDKIEIHELKAKAILGVHDHERREKQDVVISLTLFTDTRKAGESDDLKDALDYDAVARRVVEFVEASQFQLVEKLAGEIAGICLGMGASRVIVTVEKPNALPAARSVGVTIERTA